MGPKSFLSFDRTDEEKAERRGVAIQDVVINNKTRGGSTLSD